MLVLAEWWCIAHRVQRAVQWVAQLDPEAKSPRRLGLDRRSLPWRNLKLCDIALDGMQSTRTGWKRSRDTFSSPSHGPPGARRRVARWERWSSSTVRFRLSDAGSLPELFGKVAEESMAMGARSGMGL